MKYLTDVLKGNANSGNHGHAGRPGMRGGSVAGGGHGGGGGFVPELSQASMHMLAASKNPNLVQSNMNLGGGIGSTRLVQIKDDGKVVYKPDSENSYRIHPDGNRVATQHEVETARLEGRLGDFSPVRHTITDEKIPASARERAAYEIDRAMGLGVTPSVEVVEYGRGKGSGMEFTEGRAAAKYFGEVRRTDAEMAAFENHPDVESIALLDFAIGNTDRHAGNFRLESGTGRWRAIDNGLSFPDKGNKQFRSVPGRHLASKDIAISPRAKSAIAKLEPNLNKIMKRNGFGLKAIRAVRARLDILKTAFTWSDARRTLDNPPRKL